MENLRKNPFALHDDKADFDIPTASLQIYQFINHYLARSPGTVDRFSAANYCVLRRWFDKNLTDTGTPLTPRKRILFLMGDLAEMTMNYFILQGLVGEGKLYSEISFGKVIGEFKIQNKPIYIYEQPEWHLNVDGIKITGHPDGIGKRNSDGEWELIEIKSAANYGFKSFKEDGPGSYLLQAHAAMLSDEGRKLDIKSVRFFYIRKETGHIWDRLEKYSVETAAKVWDDFKAVHGPRMEPPHELKDEVKGKKPMLIPTGRKFAAFPCSYCHRLEACRGSFVTEWRAKQWQVKSPTFYFGDDERLDKVVDNFLNKKE